LGDAPPSGGGSFRAMAHEERQLLRRLTANEEDSLRMVLTLRPEMTAARPVCDTALTPRIRTLVRLAALVAADAPTTSLRWAVELAWSTGAGDEEIVAVLLSVGREVGLPRIVDGAPRLAAAIGYDVDD
jgi:alkylhydroperoxidase/carboxymuconolactone decarboxylase family protein YurZ